jgi:hypothetical protein
MRASVDNTALVGCQCIETARSLNVPTPGGFAATVLRRSSFVKLEPQAECMCLCISNNRSTPRKMLKKSRLLTRPPTGRYFSPAPPSDCFAIDFPGRAMSPGEGLLVFPTSPSGEQPDCPSLRASDEIHDPSKLARFSLQGWGLIDLPLRASNEGLLRPRVARAQKIIRLHPSSALRARRTVCLLPRIFLRPRVTRARGSSQPSRPLFSILPGF